MFLFPLLRPRKSGTKTEERHQISRDFFARTFALSVRLYCPTILLPKVAAGIARPTGRTGFATRTVEGIKQLPNLTLVTLNGIQADLATDIAITCRLRGADAVYVAVASEYGVTLVTWDAEVLARGASAVTGMTPADWLAANPA